MLKCSGVGEKEAVSMDKVSVYGTIYIRSEWPHKNMNGSLLPVSTPHTSNGGHSTVMGTIGWVCRQEVQQEPCRGIQLLASTPHTSNGGHSAVNRNGYVGRKLNESFTFCNSDRAQLSVTWFFYRNCTI